MPPLPAFLSNLQQPAPAQAYGAQNTSNSALAGSPAQYLTSRPHQGSAAAPQYPAVSGETCLVLALYGRDHQRGCYHPCVMLAVAALPCAGPKSQHCIVLDVKSVLSRAEAALV